MRKLLLVGFIVLPVLAGGCFKRAVDFPKGPQTIHVRIESSPLSLDRRGTHMLLTGSTLLSFAESQTVNLRAFEGQSVELQGTYEANIRATDLPVFVVTGIKGQDQNLKNWKIPSLSLELKTPRDWDSVKTSSGAKFTFSGATVILVAENKKYDEKVFSPTPKRGFEYSPLPISGLRAIKSKAIATGKVTLTIDRGSSSAIPPEKRFLVLTFTPPASIKQEDAMVMFDTVERTIKLGAAPSSSGGSSVAGGVSSDGTVNAQGTPCGGVAGILCPGGFYCNITDKTSNSGVCAKF